MAVQILLYVKCVKTYYRNGIVCFSVYKRVALLKHLWPSFNYRTTYRKLFRCWTDNKIC